MAWWNDPRTARRILETYRTFAVVGCSNDPGRASHRVARYLRGQGYRVIPINPSETSCDGHECYPDLASVPEPIEVVDIFRRAEFVAAHVDEGIAVGARALWGQLGVIDVAAAEKARRAGLDVVMDRCPAIDHPRLIGRGRDL